MPTLHLCVTSAGRRVELINSLRVDARSLNLEPQITAIDLNANLSAASQLADQSHSIVRCTDRQYIPQLI